jgi:hypothetical protein
VGEAHDRRPRPGAERSRGAIVDIEVAVENPPSGVGQAREQRRLVAGWLEACHQLTQLPGGDPGDLQHVVDAAHLRLVELAAKELQVGRERRHQLERSDMQLDRPVPAIDGIE